MRVIAISLLSVTILSGCVSLHADVPEEAIRHHLAHEEGIELASTCSYEGKRFSEGAIACMAERSMTCAPTGRWLQNGGC